MIELRDVSFAYADGAEAPGAVLSGVNLRLHEGELAVVTGRTGAGKSTLLGAMTGLVPHFTGGTLSGQILIDGRDVTSLPPRERADVIGYVGQDPLAGFVTDTVEEELAYGMEQMGVAPNTMRRRVEETLDLLGLAALRHRDLRTLSGGEQQRVALGSVLTMHPRLLVLDEPTSALDPTAAEDVLATLARLVADLGLTVVMAEHRLERVVPFADQLVRVDVDGHVQAGPPAEMLRDALIAPPLVELGRLLRWQPLPLTVREARRAARGLTLMPPAPISRPQTDRLIAATGLVVTHGTGSAGRAVNDVDLTLEVGTVTALMGRNGAGKSSLMWALQGSGRRTAGRVRVNSTEGPQDPATLSPQQRRRLIGLVPQSAADLLYLETVADECAAADHAAGAPEGACRNLLDVLVPGIDDHAHPRDLSEGQRLALVLAIVLTAQPAVLLLDEPTRGLDYPAKHALAHTLQRLARDSRAVLVSTHDVEFAAQVADAVVVMADGEIVSRGEVTTVLSESPAFAPQVTKVLGEPWLRVDQVADALGLEVEVAPA